MRPMAAACGAGLVLVALLSAAPGVAADGEPEAHGTTSTGDVDTYGVWPYSSGVRPCSFEAVLVDWEIQLTLQAPLPGDRVLLTSQGQFGPAAADVATYGNPTITVSPTSGGCLPPVEVTGLTVSGDLGYTLFW